MSENTQKHDTVGASATKADGKAVGLRSRAAQYGGANLRRIGREGAYGEPVNKRVGGDRSESLVLICQECGEVFETAAGARFAKWCAECKAEMYALRSSDREMMNGKRKQYHKRKHLYGGAVEFMGAGVIGLPMWAETYCLFMKGRLLGERDFSEALAMGTWPEGCLVKKAEGLFLVKGKGLEAVGERMKDEG